jgi:hypothetical protein
VGLEPTTSVTTLLLEREEVPFELELIGILYSTHDDNLKTHALVQRQTKWNCSTKFHFICCYGATIYQFSNHFSLNLLLMIKRTRISSQMGLKCHLSVDPKSEVEAL